MPNTRDDRPTEDPPLPITPDSTASLPVVRVTGEGRNVGKTTLATSLIAWLTERGHRVSAIKRTHHPLPPDRQGSDTHLLAQAGATRVAFVGPDGVLERSAPTPFSEVIARLAHDADIVLVEGYRDESIGIQLHLTGTPPAQVQMRIGNAPFQETASANDLALLGDFIERTLTLPGLRPAPDLPAQSPSLSHPTSTIQ